jgi:anaerobic selenocysteine-containing dehydrogenase
MKISRRSFLEATGASTLGTAISLLGPAGEKVKAAEVPPMKTAHTKQSTTICPFCAVSCGLIVSTQEGKVVNTEGDPDHPISEGSLCSKGMSLYQVVVNDRRLRNVLYRAPGSDHWEEKPWEWALPEIAKRIKKTRDVSLIHKEGNKIVNRTDGIACLGGAALDNEECYLYSKLARALGITYLEHQARI